MKRHSVEKMSKGFTLIELIVVIAILGILAAVAVPRLAGFTAEAKDSANESNKAIAKNAAAIWLTENGSPTSTLTWDGTRGQGWEKYLGTWPEGVEKVNIGTDGSVNVILGASATSPTASPVSNENDQLLVDDAMAILTALPVTTSDPASEANPRILAPSAADGITYSFISSNVSQGGASINIGTDGSYAVVTRHGNQDRSGSITLQASLNGSTSSKTFTVNIPSGAGNVTVLY